MNASLNFFTMTAVTLSILSGYCYAAVPNNSDVPAPAGLYEILGYNRILDIDNEKVTAYVAGNGYCYPQEKTELDLDRISSVTEDGFKAFIAGGITQYTLIKRDTLPDNCSSKNYLSKADPVSVFNVFWSHFYDNYKFFELHGVDWLSVYARYRPMVTEDMSETDLFDLLKKTLSGIDDGHVSIDATIDGKEVSWSAERHTSFFKALDIYMRNNLSRFPDVDLTSYDDMDDAFEDTMPDFIEENLLSDNARRALGNGIMWGAVKQFPDLGYLYIDSMEFTDTEQIPVELATVSKVMTEKVLPNLKNYPAIIVDVRFNGGGYDAVALLFASIFASDTCVAFTKYAPAIGGKGNGQTVYLSPHKQLSITQGPIMILTSPESASATEIFLLALREQANITTFGEASEGILSDTWSGMLPNGWEITLSNETYLSNEGNLYEGKGIPPDIPYTIFDGKDMYDSVYSSTLEAAKRLKAQLSTFDANASHTCKNVHSDTEF